MKAVQRKLIDYPKEWPPILSPIVLRPICGLR